jgi:hypothetical protein
MANSPFDDSWRYDGNPFAGEMAFSRKRLTVRLTDT